MTRSVPAVVTFNAGELSPTLRGRVDLARYASGCKTLHNMLVLPEGPVTRRPGTRYVANTKADGVARLIPFEFSTVQAYVIEVGDGYMRFYRDGGVIESSPGTPYEIVSPYAAGEIADLRWAQSADVLYLAHPLYLPRKLTRTGHTSWTLSQTNFVDGPYIEQRTDRTITPSGTTGAITLTASAALFTANDVGRLVRVLHGSTWGAALITAFTSSTVVDANVQVTMGATTASTAFRLGAWYIGNYPGQVTFFEERLFWAGAPAAPQTAWGSMTGDFENMTPGAAADDAVTFSILDGQVNAIRWLAPLRAMLAGTASAEFALSGEDGLSLTPTSAQARRQTTVGSASVAALTAGFGALHVGRSSRTVWELGFSAERDGYIGTEVSVLARHVLRPGVVEMVWQQDPWRCVWCVLGDGTLAGLTYMRDQDVIAWHRHTLGGPSTKALSAAVIPAGAEGQLWLLVERDYAGTPKRTVEYLAPEFVPDDDPGDATDAFMVDCGLTYDGAATASIGGLDHLEGQTVQVLADGATHEDVEVSSGTITLDRDAEVAHIGFGYTAEVEPLDIQGGTPDGSGLTRMKRVSRVGLMLYRTVGGQIGWRDADGATTFEDIETRVGSDPMDTAPPLVSGTFYQVMPPRWDRDASVVVRQDQPLPLTVLGIVPRMVTND